MKKLGVLTIGQSPRPDMLEDLIPIFGSHVDLVEMGALDGLDEAAIQNLAPGPKDRILVTKLADGRVVQVAEAGLMGCMEEKVRLLEEQDVSCIFILCTARFDGLKSTVPCIEPGSVLNRMVPLCAATSSIGVLSPEPEQIPSTKKDWNGVVKHIEVLTASPNGEDLLMEEAGRQFGQMDIDLIVLDCMGYQEKHRKLVAAASGKPVILSKALAAKVVSELLED